MASPRSRGDLSAHRRTAAAEPESPSKREPLDLPVRRHVEPGGDIRFHRAHGAGWLWSDAGLQFSLFAMRGSRRDRSEAGGSATHLKGAAVYLEHVDASGVAFEPITWSL